jgi:BT1 family
MAAMFPGPVKNPYQYREISQREDDGDDGPIGEEANTSGDFENNINKTSPSKKDDVHRQSAIGVKTSSFADDGSDKRVHFYLDPGRRENIGIFLSYFCVGFALYFLSSPISYYLVSDLNASSTQLGVLATVQGLPWSFKILYGLLSDSVPILGYRRKPYFGGGWLIYIGTSLYYRIVRYGLWVTFGRCRHRHASGRTVKVGE